MRDAAAPQCLDLPPHVREEVVADLVAGHGRQRHPVDVLDDQQGRAFDVRVGDTEDRRHPGPGGAGQALGQCGVLCHAPGRARWAVVAEALDLQRPPPAQQQIGVALLPPEHPHVGAAVGQFGQDGGRAPVPRDRRDRPGVQATPFQDRPHEVRIDALRRCTEQHQGQGAGQTAQGEAGGEVDGYLGRGEQAQQRGCADAHVGHASPRAPQEGPGGRGHRGDDRQVGPGREGPAGEPRVELLVGLDSDGSGVLDEGMPDQHEDRAEDPGQRQEAEDGPLAADDQHPHDHDRGDERGQLEEAHDSRREPTRQVRDQPHQVGRHPEDALGIDLHDEGDDRGHHRRHDEAGQVGGVAVPTRGCQPRALVGRVSRVARRRCLLDDAHWCTIGSWERSWPSPLPGAPVSCPPLRGGHCPVTWSSLRSLIGADSCRWVAPSSASPERPGQGCTDLQRPNTSS